MSEGFDLRLRRITSSPSKTLRRRLVRTTDAAGAGVFGSTLVAVRRGFDFQFFTLRDSYG